MNTTTRKLTFTLPLLLAAGLLVVMFHTTSGAASFRRGAPLSAQVIYVDADATGAASGLSWTNAYTNLQDALAAASSSDEVWVAEGVYYPDEGAGQTNDLITSTFQLIDSVELYGGFAATETLREQRNWEAHITVLSGDLDQNDTTDAHGVVTDTANIAGSNAYHVVTGSGVTATARLDGFTVTAGQADGAWADPCENGCGGGMYNDGGSPTLINLSFSGNDSIWGGGGIVNKYGSSSTLDNVTFYSNESTYRGGGMYNIYNSNPTLTNVSFSGNAAIFGEGGGMFNGFSSPTLTNVSFSGNSADHGGGMHNSVSSPILTDVNFSDNTADYVGGGMDNSHSSNSSLDNVIFSGNAAGSSGGGMANFESNPMLTNVSFSGNVATLFGGGMSNDISSPMLTNVTFSGNTAAEWYGGGMANYANSSPTLTNVSFSGNAAGVEGGGIWNYSSSPAIRNSILWNNQDAGGTDASAQIHNESVSTPTISSTLVMGSGGSGVGWDTSLGTDGGGNLDADPLFVTPVDPNDAPTTEGNLRLQNGSPAIDAGNDSYVTVPIDLDGNPRIVGDAVDMGAYENQGTPSVNPIPDQTMVEGQVQTVSVSARDPNGDDLLLSFSNLPTFASASDNGDWTGVITFTTDFDDAGSYPNIAVTATDTGGLSDTESFSLTVQASPQLYLPLIVR